MQYKNLFYISLALTILAKDGIAEALSANPYRPTVSNPASLSAPGWIEIEAGLSRTHGGEDKQVDTLPYLIKYAFTPDWGILLSGNAFARRVDQDDLVTRGYGDTGLALKFHHALSEKIAWGLEAGFKSPTAKTGLGTGKTDYGINTILSVDSELAHIDLNGGVTQLGDHAEGYGQQAYTWAVAASRPLHQDWNLELELSGLERRGRRKTAQFLTAISYEWTKRTVFDFGASTGIGRSAPAWSVFAGVTVLWEKLH